MFEINVTRINSSLLVEKDQSHFKQPTAMTVFCLYWCKTRVSSCALHFEKHQNYLFFTKPHFSFFPQHVYMYTYLTNYLLKCVATSNSHSIFRLSTLKFI